VKAPKLAPEQVELVRARAETALGDSGSSAETAELYQLLVRIDPRDGMAWFNLGDALRTIGRLQEAEEALVTARELAPKAHRFTVDARLGMLLTKKGSPAEAEKWFRLATSNSECPGWVWVLRAANLRRKESHRLARECLKTARRRGNFDLEEVLLNEALIDCCEGNYGDAADRAAEALKLDPNYLPAKELLASVQGAAEARRFVKRLQDAGPKAR
jgi:tetratricopeptide (TPR) repeat protein